MVRLLDLSLCAALQLCTRAAGAHGPALEFKIHHVTTDTPIRTMVHNPHIVHILSARQLCGPLVPSRLGTRPQLRLTLDTHGPRPARVRSSPRRRLHTRWAPFPSACAHCPSSDPSCCADAPIHGVPRRLRTHLAPSCPRMAGPCDKDTARVVLCRLRLLL